MLVAKQPDKHLNPRQRLVARQKTHDPDLRRILVCVHNGDIQMAHSIVDEIAKATRKRIRYRDISLADTGTHQFIVADLDRAGVYTVGDLFNSSVERLMTYTELGNIARAMGEALKTLCELQDLPAG